MTSGAVTFDFGVKEKGNTISDLRESRHYEQSQRMVLDKAIQPTTEFSRHAAG